MVKTLSGFSIRCRIWILSRLCQPQGLCIGSQSVHHNLPITFSYALNVYAMLPTPTCISYSHLEMFFKTQMYEAYPQSNYEYSCRWYPGSHRVQGHRRLNEPKPRTFKCANLSNSQVSPSFLHSSPPSNDNFHTLILTHCRSLFFN